MELPDIVYVVRPGEINQTLKYSLRSLANLPHRQVFVVGYGPEWLRNVGVMAVPKLRGSKFDSVEANLRFALTIRTLADTFIYMNDDFFITKPIETVPVQHGGPAEGYRPAQEMRGRFARTIAELHTPSYTYDGTHVPMPIHTETARELIPQMPPGMLWRTWYGNRACIGGTYTRDVKYRGKRPMKTDGPFLSTAPFAFREVRAYLEDVLPKENPYVADVIRDPRRKSPGVRPRV